MKLDEKEKINRLGIYFFFDKEGIVGRHVLYMLGEIKKCASQIIVVCNGKLTKDSREKLEAAATHVLVREDSGFGLWAYKAALDYYGWDKLAAFDEIVMMDSTLYGPLYPVEEMFAEMNSRDVDFWGIARRSQTPTDPYVTTVKRSKHEPILASFMCVRSKMASSPEFRLYWDKLPQCDTYTDSIANGEQIFTEKFADCGFVDDVYVDTTDLVDFTDNPFFNETKELIAGRKCPFVGKSTFACSYHNYLATSSGENSIETFNYIRDNLDYDLDMVWEDLLRTCNMADIKNSMHLEYVLSKTAVTEKSPVSAQKTALFMHLYFPDLIDSSMHYAGMMPEDADIYFTVCKGEMYEKVTKAAKVLAPRKVTVITIENRGRDVSSLLVGMAPYVMYYDVACFVHDKKTTAKRPYTVGESFAYRCFENVLGSREYVSNIIGRFAKEPRLGMLMPPVPSHASFFDVTGNEWTINCDITKKLAEELNINVDIDPAKEPVAPLGTMFWFRPKALKPLFDKKWKFEDFPKEPNHDDGTILHGIERIYGYCAQSQGYYPALVMNDQYASIELTNVHFAQRELAQTLHSAYGYFGSMYGAEMYIINNGTAVKSTSSRRKIKQKIHSIMPKKLWNGLRNIYHRIGGKKWLG